MHSSIYDNKVDSLRRMRPIGATVTSSVYSMLMYACHMAQISTASHSLVEFNAAVDVVILLAHGLHRLHHGASAEFK